MNERPRKGPTKRNARTAFRRARMVTVKLCEDLAHGTRQDAISSSPILGT